ncbi:MAG TPA: hypothetical protein VFY42_02130 [Gemmatimonadales bacterium]|nr:hypothetical protein [Gemmatimonadales bacterium]
MAIRKVWGTFIRDKNGAGVEIDELVHPHATKNSALEEKDRLAKTFKGVHVEPLEVLDNAPDRRVAGNRPQDKP